MTLRPLTLVGIILSIVTGISLGVLAHVMTKDRVFDQQASTTLDEALRQVSESYVEEISQEELLSHAIEGMMTRLDDHSDYLNKDAFSSLRADTTGRFGGIGIELGLVDGFFTVVAPLDNTPAQRAGLQAGDRITRLDGTSLRGWQLSKVVAELRGEPGSPIELTIRRKGVDKLLTVALQRQVIEVASVTSRMLEPDIGYVRISQFQTSTGDDVKESLETLANKNHNPLQGLVIDLRNNPGGTLQSSVEVADAFIEQGLIVYTEGRLRSSHAKYRASKGDLLAGMPMVVLINSGSASASEIVAGALQDHGRAQLLGSRSYGKGSVQSVLPLNKEQALKLTTAYYFTPNGRSIHETGIDPDVEFSGSEEELLDQAVTLLREQNTQHARL